MWFEVFVVSSITAVGSIFFSRIEKQTSKWRKVLKVVFFILATTSISATMGRVWAFGFLTLAMLFVVYIHVVWHPKKGFNGWTGDAKDKYYALRGWKKKEKA